MITLEDIENVRGMKIVRDLPPNIAAIEKVFHPEVPDGDMTSAV